MRTIRLLAMGLGIALAVPAAMPHLAAPAAAQEAARESAEPRLSIQGLSEEERRVFLAGMAQGLTYLRTMQRYGRDFCLPVGGQLTADYLWELMAEKVHGPRRLETIGPMVTSLLSQKFPCPDVDAVAIKR